MYVFVDIWFNGSTGGFSDSVYYPYGQLCTVSGLVFNRPRQYYTIFRRGAHSGGTGAADGMQVYCIAIALLTGRKRITPLYVMFYRKLKNQLMLTASRGHQQRLNK